MTCSNSWATAPKACTCRAFFALCGKFIILGYKDKTEGKSQQHQDNKEKKPHEEQERDGMTLPRPHAELQVGESE